MNQHAEAEEYEEKSGSGPLAWLWDRFKGHDDYEEEEDEVAEPQPQQQHTPSAPRPSAGNSFAPLRRPGAALRLDQARPTHVTVRRAVHSFDDARRAADGLKGGQQQIVNLEQTPADMAERIVDFLNGATYALDGSVEKIGEQVYLFTPSSVVIEIEDRPAATGTRAAFFDRE